MFLLMIAIGAGVGPASASPSDRDASTVPSLRDNSLTTPKAVVLGIIEGVTEFLPVSSTGHLLVAERIFDIGQSDSSKDAIDTFTVVIQIGAILAVLGIFRKRFVLMAEGVIGKSAEGRNLLLALSVAFVPAAAIAVLLSSPIKDKLLRPWPVVGAWFLGGVIILVFVANQSRLRVTTTKLSDVTIRQGLIIGVAQVLALWPGTSRSLVTILAALLLGLSLQAAVEFSFLLGFLTLSAATGYELLKNGSALYDTFGWANPLIGTVVAGIAAFISVKWMVSYLEHKPLTIFGWYRIGAASVVGILLATSVI